MTSSLSLLREPRSRPAGLPDENLKPKSPVAIGNSRSLVVQSVQYWHGQHLTEGLNGTGDRRVLSQGQARSRRTRTFKSIRKARPCDLRPFFARQRGVGF